jgi:hypothetical protein
VRIVSPSSVGSTVDWGFAAAVGSKLFMEWATT